MGHSIVVLVILEREQSAANIEGKRNWLKIQIAFVVLKDCNQNVLLSTLLLYMIKRW